MPSLVGQQQGLKQALEKMLEPSQTTVFQLQKLAGYAQSVNWDELRAAPFAGVTGICRGRRRLRARAPGHEGRSHGGAQI